MKKVDRFAIIGAGRIGRALGRQMAARGLRPGGISCRRLQSARRAAVFIGGGKPTTSNALAVGGARLVIISTPDGAISPVARALARAAIDWKGRIVAHTSGALSSGALDPLARRGADVASCHPLISIPDPRLAQVDFSGVPFGIEGAPRAVREMRRLVRLLGGDPVAIPRRAKALYHLVACFLSNDLVALLAIGLDAAAGLGLGRGGAARLYLPLVRGTVRNVERLGAVGALTGPVSRGDLATLRIHARPLRSLPARFGALHRLLALRCAGLALEGRRIDPGAAARVARLLRRPP
jgi:predicted short-subunit dehydrogenase-like oxidoreductase (DUF2520 family)